MYYVYILESAASSLLYIGQSSDPLKRLQDHNRGASPYTKGNGPYKIIFLKEFESRSKALACEKKLKSWKNPARVRSWIAREQVG